MRQLARTIHDSRVVLGALLTLVATLLPLTSHASVVDNDNFADAATLSGQAGEITGTTVGASLQPNEPDHCGFHPSNSVWYRWTAPSAGEAIFSTFGSTFDTDLAIYTGTSMSSLTLENCSDDFIHPYKYGWTVVEAVPGTTYHIAVAAERGIPGDLQLRWTNVPSTAPHDDLSNASPLDGETGWRFASNYGSGVDVDEPLHADEDGGSSVWYEWTASQDGSVTFTTRYSDVDTLLAVYTGSTYIELSEVASNNNYGIEWANRPGNSQVTFDASAGTSYKIAVDTYTATYDYFELHWGPPPANDDFENSQSIEGLPTSALGDVTFATAEASEPVHTFWSVANSVWYSWTAPADGPVGVRVTALDWGWDPEVAVYTGPDVAHLAPVEWFRNDTGSDYNPLVDFAATAGTTYHFAVERTDGPGGRLQIELRPSKPRNDDLSAAKDLGTGRTAALSSNNWGGTKEQGESDHAGRPGSSSVWYGYTAPASGTIALSTHGSSIDTTLAVYKGDGHDSMTPIAANDDWNGSGSSYVTFPAEVGARYAIAIDSPNGKQGVFKLRLQNGEPPVNDDFARAVALSGQSIAVQGTNDMATEQAGEPDHASNPGGASVWYRWAAPFTGEAAFDVRGMDSLAAVYTGTSVASLTEVASNDDRGANSGESHVVFHADEDVTYHLAIDGAWRGLAPVMKTFQLTGSIVPDVVDVQPPTVKLTSPTPGDASNDSFHLSAVAHDDHRIDRVEFYARDLPLGSTQLIATDRTAPYEDTWAPSVERHYRVHAVAYDRQGLSAQSEPVEVRYDVSPPTIPGPTPLPRSDQSVRQASAVYNLNLTRNQEIELYRIQRRTGNGSWHPFGMSDSGRLRDRLIAERSYQYRVKTTDLAGNTSSWSEGPLVSYRVLSESATHRTSGWRRVANPRALGGYDLRSETKGAEATFESRGRSAFALIGSTAPRQGRARLRIEGYRPYTVDFTSKNTRHRKIMTTGFLPRRWKLSLKVLSVEPGSSVVKPVIIDGLLLTNWVNPDR